MSTTNNASVLISGAGPSGLVLALTLRKNGIPVRIIDKELGPRLGERGAGVSPRSLELHRILGTFKDIYGDGKTIPMKVDYDPLDGYKVMRTSVMVPIQEASIGVPYPNFISVGQNHQERILRAHLEQLGTKVEFGTELRNFTQSTGPDGKVEVEILHRTADGKEEINKETVSWLVGTDGAHSTVRKALKFDFVGETKEGFEIIIGDFRISSGVREFWENWGDQKDKIAFTRSSDRDPDVLVFLIAGNIETERLLASPQAIIEEFYKISGRRDIVIEDVIIYNRYRPNIRMVNELRTNRVFIAGDAAHCHTPAGGQGLNSSIQDAFNLGWKLALVEKGFAPEPLLNTYAEERLPIIAEILDKTTELLSSRITGATTANKPTQSSIEKDMTQMGVTYRGSSIILHEDREQDSWTKVTGYNKDSETAALPGDRAPEAPSLIDVADNKKLDLFTLLSPSRHSVFVFAEDYSNDTLEAISEVISRQPKDTTYSVVVNKKGERNSSGKFDRVLVDDEGHAYSTYNVNTPCVVIVRPDGFIGARIGGSQGIEQYFKGIFRP